MTTTIDKKTLAAHVILTLHLAQRRGRAATVETVADELGVRKTDVREVVSLLHREGHVDGQRMRLTFTGFALAISLRGCRLRDLRSAPEASVRAA